MASDSFAELGAKFHNLTYAIHNGNRRTVEEMSFAVKQEFEKGPPRSGWSSSAKSRRGVKLWSVQYNIRGTKNAVGLVKYRGPVHWLERGTKPHRIAPTKAVGSRAKRADPASPLRYRGPRGSIKVGGTRHAAYAMHRGTGARPFMWLVKSESKRVALAQLERTTHTNVIRAGFGK